MPFAHFSRVNIAFRSGVQKLIQGQQVLESSVYFLLGRGRLVGNSRFSHSLPFPTVGEAHLVSRFGTGFARSDSCATDQRRNSFQTKIMTTYGSPSTRAELGSAYQENSALKCCQLSNFVPQATLSYTNKSLDYCRQTSMRLRNREPCGSNLVFGYFLSDVIGRSWKSNLFSLTDAKDFQSSCSAPCSAGAAPDVSFDGSAREEQHGSSVASSDQKILGERSLRLLSGSSYLPHPDKEETGGEDAHFICIDEQAIGVADGVGGWADLGIDSGHYARELMSHSVSAIQQEPKGSIDPARVLEKAYSSTKAKGSSTACIIALTEQGLHAVNLGDSGFIVVRDGCTIFRSPAQQHDFNFTYQLACGSESDLPSSGQVFTIPVASGDVIIAGTDGLFDNLYNNEVTAVVVHAIRAGLGPQVTAQKIAALARQRALDKDRQTPFSTAAQDAGYRYYGGKLDDITVVVSYITTSI
ncbi:putative protein phosphatase 2C 80 isoform X2 [Tasmannia lanceolata]|uniref:putative protein phosphatase 2C 80 isoform X2 n=1 Tax=Tasmannia lanceolata TaxID=3420 RepID=UPI004062B9A4